MEGDFRVVKPMSSEIIEQLADSVRQLFRLDPSKKVKMVNLLETVLPEVLRGYSFEVLPDEDMPGMDGVTILGDHTICLSNTTYVGLCDGKPEARIVAAHEFGHLMLHSNQGPALAKRNRYDERVDPEWQADRFADAWLMPWDGVARCRSARHVAAKYCVPDLHAERRFEEVRLGKEIQGELF